MKEGIELQGQNPCFATLLQDSKSLIEYQINSSLLATSRNCLSKEEQTVENRFLNNAVQTYFHDILLIINSQTGRISFNARMLYDVQRFHSYFI